MYRHTYHSDLRQEIAYLQAQLDYKRRKLADCLRDKTPFAELEKLYDEIREIETKMQICFEEAKAQSDEDRREE
jgi:hypothetical protein